MDAGRMGGVVATRAHRGRVGVQGPGGSLNAVTVAPTLGTGPPTLTSS